MYELIQHITNHPALLAHIRRWMAKMPKPFAALACCILGWLIYWFTPSLRNLIIANMNDLLGEPPGRKFRKECRAFYQNLSFILYEILLDPVCMKDGEKRMILKGESYLNDILAEGRGAILFTPHMGNFFFYYWLLSQKYDCLTVATAGSKELRPIYLQFQQLGCNGLDYDALNSLEIMREIRKHLQNNGVVFLLGDFWRPTFPEASFFGRTTCTPSGTALFAIQHHVPVLPFFGYRRSGFVHELEILPPLRIHEEFDRSQLREAMDKLNLILEKLIRTHTAQWFYWFNVHERWEQNVKKEKAGGSTVA